MNVLMLRRVSSSSFASVPHSPLLEPQKSQRYHRRPQSHPTAHLDDRASHAFIAPFMTLTPQNYASSWPTTQSTSPAQSASQSAPDSSSPPSSFAMSSQPAQQPAITATNAFPTPASSVSGVLKESNDQVEHSLMGAGSALGCRDIEHGLPQSEQNTQQQQADLAGSSLDEDAMDIDQNDSLSEDPKIAELQRDIGQAFHTCKTCKASNLLFGL